MNNWPTKKITTILILATIAIWGLWDLVAVWTPKPGDTESEIILHAFQSHPSLVYLFGVLCGHWTWPKRGGFDYDEMLIGWGLGAVIFAGSHVVHWLQHVPVAAMFLAGYVAGHYLWGQSPRKKR
jgi:hypothetical protein